MKKRICILFSAIICLMPLAFAETTRVNGDIDLTWANAYARPQEFSGDISGDLAGQITLTSTTDYDTSSIHIGATWSDNVRLDLNDGVICEGVYGGNTVNDGRNVGTFLLSCDDSSTINGMMHGVNDAYGNMDLKYSGLKIVVRDGEKGEQGIKGDKGNDGINGIDGKDGAKGDQGIPGEQGIQGIQGEKGQDGINGLDGAKGEQGIQGEKGDTGLQGIKGDKGDQGEPTDVTPILTRLTSLENKDVSQDLEITNLWTDDNNKWDAIHSLQAAVNPIVLVIDASRQYSGFNDFWTWYNSPKECTANQNKCEGNDRYKCVNYAWAIDKTCEYGCSNGECNPKPKENCYHKEDEFLRCEGNYKALYTTYSGQCKSGHGTSSSCDIGFCKPDSYSSHTHCYSPKKCSVEQKGCA